MDQYKIIQVKESVFADKSTSKVRNEMIIDDV